MFMWLPMLLLAATCVGFASCGDDDDNGGAIPMPGTVVSTISSSDITCEEGSDELSLSAALVPSGGKAVLTATPAVKADAGVIEIVGKYDAEQGKYVFSFSSLESGVTYTIVITIYNSSNQAVRRSRSREVTVNEEHTVIPTPDPEPTPGDETPEGETSCPDGNHPHAIDLGLPSGTKWACCNVGATKPEEYGLYFAWGETVGYGSDTSDGHVFNWTTYKWCNCNGSAVTLTKYVTGSSFGTVDNKTELDLEDDAAYVNWGAGWRMPSPDQTKELINSDYTTREWTSVNGVNGHRFTSKTNGNSIFLPSAGYRKDGELYGRGAGGSYWSSSLMSFSTYINGFPFNLGFYSGNWHWGGHLYDRSDGHSVRAVCR